jgi:hypothetical protein
MVPATELRSMTSCSKQLDQLVLNLSSVRVGVLVERAAPGWNTGRRARVRFAYGASAGRSSALERGVHGHAQYFPEVFIDPRIVGTPREAGETQRLPVEVERHQHHRCQMREGLI